MMRRALRGIVVGAALVMLVLTWTSLVTPHAFRSYADYGLREVSQVDAGPIRRLMRFDNVAARYDRDPSGPQVGDIVDFRRVSFPTIADFYTVRAPVLTLPVERGGKLVNVTLRRVWTNAPISSETYAGVFLATVSLIVAIVLFVRAPSVMTAALIAYALGTPYARPILSQLDLVPDWLYVILNEIPMCLAIEFPSFALLAFVARFPRVPATRVGCSRVRSADAIVVVSAVACTVLALWERYLYTFAPIHQALAILATVLVLLYTVWSFRSTVGEERQRIAWVLAGLVITDAAYLLGNYVDEMAASDFVSIGTWAFWGVVCQLAGVALPLALAYVVARHRVVDVGFAFNRAAVFTATSLLIVGLFAGLQWAANTYLVRMYESHGLVVQMGIAIAVFFMVRALRAGTERAITQVFFARRRRRIDAILGIVGQFADLTDPYAISPLVVRELGEGADLDAIFYVQRGIGFERISGSVPSPSAFAEGDPLPERLRSGLRPIEVEDGELEDWLALPLFVRARLKGMLFVRSRSGESLAPDEVEALRSLAAEMLIAHEDLIADAQRREIERLTAAPAV
jgi:hypothetical protein